MVSIDDEWKQFLMKQTNDDCSNWNPIMIPELSSGDDTIEDNLDSDSEFSRDNDEQHLSTHTMPTGSVRNPCEELYISTQTQIFFLNI